VAQHLIEAHVAGRCGPAPSAVEATEAPTVAIDGSGQIVEANRAWHVAALRGGVARGNGVGANYLAICDMAAGPDAEGAREAARGIRAVLGGDRGCFSMDYPCSSGGDDRWFSLRVTARTGGGAVVSHLDVSALKAVELRLQREETELPQQLDRSTPIFALLDATGSVRHVSEASCRLLGLDADELVGASALDRLDPEELARAQAAFARVLNVPAAKERIEVTAVDGDGRRRHLDLVVANLLDEPAVGAIAVTGSDVTGSRRAQITRLLESRLLSRLPASVIVTDERGVVVYWNDRAASIFGFTSDHALGRPIAELNIGPVGVEDARRIMETAAASGHWEGAYDARRADGSIVPLHVTLERIDDDEIDFHGLVGASLDISERRKLEDDIAFQALHDPLTGLPNRLMLVEQLDGAVARDGRRCGLTAVVFLDVDDFSSINDSVGHVAGDEVLRTVAELLCGVVREGDMVARLGGDEFVVCCEDVRDVAEAYAVADRMLQVLRAPFRLGGETLTVSASVGLAVSSATRGEALLRNADAAMYAAKVAGGSRVGLFDDALHARARRRHEIALELEQAVESGALVTYFQPEVDLATDALVGFEALVRWQHPERGLIPPDEFITIAEECGLIGKIGALVLADACTALARWLERAPEHPLAVSVNVSAHQLADPGLAALVRTAIEDAGVPAARICLEVTESGLMDAPAVAEVLRALRSTGVTIAIDDFGTGYSSLSRLKSFPVDFLKIDRSFVAGLGTDAEDDVIVSAVVNLGRSLGLRLIAEGIETEEQLRLLTELGCDFGQGYLWSRPLPFDDATAYVHEDWLDRVRHAD